MTDDYKPWDTLPATTGAVDWSIAMPKDCDIERITLTLASYPTTTENIVVKLDSALGATYDCVLRSFANSGVSYNIEDISGINGADSIVIQYANSDGISVAGVAYVFIKSGLKDD